MSGPYESNTKIQYTKDYSLFRFLKGNRDLNERKIKRIIKSVESGLNFFKYNPIMVNEQHFIIDGQHRFYACRKLKLPVYFVVVPEITLQHIAEINNNQSRWKIRDYMNCYIDANVNREDYQALSDFVTKHKINISVAVSLLHAGRITNGGGYTDAFKDGKFRINYEEAAEKIVSIAKEFEAFGADYRSRPFLQAIEKLVTNDRYPHEKVVAKLAKHGLEIEKQSSAKDYMKHIEELFNYHNAKRVVIY